MRAGLAGAIGCCGGGQAWGGGCGRGAAEEAKRGGEAAGAGVRPGCGGGGQGTEARRLAAE